ncbi:MAG: YraN family protein [Gammaproteobacteria bacterium]|nr:YraN family protein [Gammaproteobacteria bacterium]
MLNNKNTNKKRIGDQKEQLAKAYLVQHQLRFIEQNFHCKWGEIDLIFQDPTSNQLVFVEVRYRSSKQYGGAAASITPAKQQKIKKSALFYLSQRKIEPNLRFDVIAIDGNEINWIQNAFS